MTLWTLTLSREIIHRIMVLRFYTPIFYLLQKYNMRPGGVEEAKQELALMVQELCKTYKQEGL